MDSYIILYMLTGAIAGISAGLFGVGGGLIIVPVLYHVFAAQAINPAHLMHMALATSLACIVITSISSSYAHHKKQAVIWPVVLLLAPGIIIGSWLGASYASTLDTRVLKPAFAVFELLVAMSMLINFSVKKTTDIQAGNGFVAGSFIGFISSIVGIGGGTLTVPILHWYKISIRNAVACSAVCGLPIALLATAAYIYHGWGLHFDNTLTAGYVNISAWLAIISISIFTAPLGAKLAHTIPEKILKNSFAVFLLFLSFRMLL